MNRGRVPNDVTESKSMISNQTHFRMIKVFFSLMVVLIFTGCSKEEISEQQSEYFIKFYGSYLENTGYDVKETSDGGLVIIGSEENESTGKDIVLMKVDEYGNQADWSPKYFGSGSDDEGYAIEVTESGYLIAGSITNNQGDKDAYLLRTNTQGNLIGQEYSYGGSDDDYAVSIENREDGGYMVVGYSEGVEAGSRNFFVISLNPDLSDPRVTTSQSDQEDLKKIIFSKEGEYIALGNQYLKSGVDTQLFIAKLNETGNIFDLAFLGSPLLKETMTDAVASNNSSIYLVGTSSESGGNNNIILKKIVDLKEEWTRTISGTGNLEGKAITLKNDGSIVIAADKTSGSDKNIVVYFLDSEGNVEDSKEYGGTGIQVAEDVLITGTHLIILGKNTHQQNSMISLIKADENGNIWE